MITIDYNIINIIIIYIIRIVFHTYPRNDGTYLMWQCGKMTKWQNETTSKNDE